MTPQSGPSIGNFCRLYSVLLYAYPRDFRLQYGAAMQQVFRDRCRDLARTASPMALLRFATHLTADWLTTSVHERAAAFWAAARKQTPRSFVTEWAVTLGIYLFVTTTLVQAYVIPTGSMEGTLRVGDHMLVDRMAYAQPGPLGAHLLPYRELKHGDIVAFLYPEDIRQTYVKRVIGLPGDHIRLDRQQVIRNGSRLIEPYTQHIATYPDPYRDNFPLSPEAYTSPRGRDMLDHHVLNGEVVVPPDMLFVLGDNRENSARQPLLGLRAAELCGRQTAVRLLVVRCADRRPERMDLLSRDRRGPALLYQDPLGPYAPGAPFPSSPGSRSYPMKAVPLAAFGWLVPGGAYLLMRRYLQFAVFAVRGVRPPLPPASLFTAACSGRNPPIYRAWTSSPSYFQSRGRRQNPRRQPFLTRPFLRRLQGFLDGRLHEYGTTLLVLAGLFNLLAVSNALELRKAER